MKMEGLVMHGAAHIFFENKLAEVEDMFNKKFKKVELKFREEILQMDKVHCHEMKKIRGELRNHAQTSEPTGRIFMGCRLSKPSPKLCY